jgi:hypothetical protein
LPTPHDVFCFFRILNSAFELADSAPWSSACAFPHRGTQDLNCTRFIRALKLAFTLPHQTGVRMTLVVFHANSLFKVSTCPSWGLLVHILYHSILLLLVLTYVPLERRLVSARRMLAHSSSKGLISLNGVSCLRLSWGIVCATHLCISCEMNGIGQEPEIRWDSE